ncbi:DNA polymerase family A [uncultured archaeon]|nr:DNA polymerase family A [uncultured archaeon]
MEKANPETKKEIKMFLVVDFETSSEAEITEVGLHNYAIHPSTKALMLSYAFVKTLFDKPVVKRWELHAGAMPADLEAGLDNPSIDLIAHNSAFERKIFKHVLKRDIPASRFQDTQASARYLSMPSRLKEVCKVLNLPAELRKDDAGEDLINVFSKPKTYSKKTLKANPTLDPIYFNDRFTHPEEWRAFGEYCDQDVRAELEVARREHLLGAFPLPERERRIWLFDQMVNERGVPTDRQFVVNLFSIADKNKESLVAAQDKATGLENSNSQAQLLPWLQERGYPLSNIRKENIQKVLKDPEVKLTPECRDVLEARMEASSTSYKKLNTIMRSLNPDNVIREMFVYMGSARCGRWSGAGVQPHNFARPDGTFEDMENVQKAREAVYRNDYDALLKMFWDEKKKKFYAPLIIAKNIIRTVFVAPPGKRFNVCDLNAIETRVAAWVAQCHSLLEVFREGKDPYIAFAVKMYGIPYEKILYDLKKNIDKVAKAAAKLMRQMAKPGVLGAVYRLGAGGWGKDKNGDTIKTGLWGYAENMGVEMTQEQSKIIVDTFRNSYPEICAPPNHAAGDPGGIWYILENAVKDVLEGERTVRRVGPRGCIVIDKLTIDGRKPILRIKLPSGRYLHYVDAAMELATMPWKQKKEVAVEFDEDGEGTKFEMQEVDVEKPCFTYYGLNQNTKQWNRIVSHGGKIFENIVQAIARDVLADKLLEFEAAGLLVVLHVHDEGVCVSDDDPFAPGKLEMEKIMNQPVSWALDLPLGSDGFEDFFYHK